MPGIFENKQYIKDIDMARVINVGQAIEAISNAPYNTMTALAELIDNSLQSGAKHIGLIAIDNIHIINTRQQARLEALAVVDDGCGMNRETLQNCLSVGFSENRKEINGIGKFGYGMSVGSISQSLRVEVYSWQKKDGPIVFTYIDIAELLDTRAEDIPDIQEIDELPMIGIHKWDPVLKRGDSGTLVIWRKLRNEKLRIKTGKGIMNHFQHDLSRIYRHFLDDDDTLGKKRHVEIIHMQKNAGKHEVVKRKQLLPNDPLYLLTPNTLPRGYKEPTNLEDGVFNKEFNFTDKDGREKQSNVKIRFSIAKPETQAVGGGTPLGQHYGKNIGVSFIRAGREIEHNDFGFRKLYETRDRWWNVEIIFNPDLDELFGVSADKQHILNIKAYTDRNPRPDDDDFDLDVQTELNVWIDATIKSHSKILMDTIQSRARGGRKRPNKDIKDAEGIANEIMGNDPSKTKSEGASEGKTREEMLAVIDEKLSSVNPEKSKEEIREEAEQMLNDAVSWTKGHWPGTTFIDVSLGGKGVIATINTDSKFYEKLYKPLEDDVDPARENALKLLLMAYSRTENELWQQIDPERKILSKFRDRWGYWVEELIELADN